MRLVVVGPAHPFRGGIAQTTTRLVSELETAGHDLRFLTPLRQYPSWLYPGHSDLDPHACPPLGCARRILDPWGPRTWSATREVAVSADADAWIVPYWTWAWSPWWLYLLQGDRRPPAVAIVHNLHDHDAGGARRLAARAVLARCRGLFTHAETLAAQLRERHPWASVGSHLLPPVGDVSPVDRVAVRERLGVAPWQRLAVFVGLIRPYKGVDLLLEAFARLPEDTPWRLVVAGEPWGGVGVELEAAVSRLRLGSRVRLELGWVSEERVGELFGAADLVVLPYLSGSQSAVAPRALAAGVPVLTTRVGGLPEMVRDGVDGRVVEPGSPGALAEALSSIGDGEFARWRDGIGASGQRSGWSSYATAVTALAADVATRFGSS